MSVLQALRWNETAERVLRSAPVHSPLRGETERQRGGRRSVTVRWKLKETQEVEEER